MTSYRAMRVAMLLRRPVLLLLVLGCVVSLEASGRFSLRLIADGMISFAFVPLIEMASLALVWRSSARRQSFARAVDLFCASNSPWLVWLVAFMALRAIESPLQAVSTPIPVLWILAATLAIVAVWAAYLDLQLFRATLAPAHPVRALVIQRLVAWSSGIAYFLGIAIWPSIVGFVRG